MRTVLVAVAVGLASAVAASAVAAAPPSRQVVEVAWYLKGEGDAVFGSQGMRQASLRCEARKGGVWCRTRIVGYRAYPVCSSGMFRVRGFGVVGQFSAPRRCGKTPDGPAS